ncbi:hypothetical protein DFH06DRAFT_1129402 [Mycena polygramma]|nr:hypothetical protein DFH06DRAFT_1129402 [Mycena polygramma]
MADNSTPGVAFLTPKLYVQGFTIGRGVSGGNEPCASKQALSKYLSRNTFDFKLLNLNAELRLSYVLLAYILFIQPRLISYSVPPPDEEEVWVMREISREDERSKDASGSEWSSVNNPEILQSPSSEGSSAEDAKVPLMREISSCERDEEREESNKSGSKSARRSSVAGGRLNENELSQDSSAEVEVSLIRDMSSESERSKDESGSELRRSSVGRGRKPEKEGPLQWRHPDGGVEPRSASYFKLQLAWEPLAVDTPRPIMRPVDSWVEVAEEIYRTWHEDEEKGAEFEYMHRGVEKSRRRRRGGSEKKDVTGQCGQEKSNPDLAVAIRLRNSWPWSIYYVRLYGISIPGGVGWIREQQGEKKDGGYHPDIQKRGVEPGFASYLDIALCSIYHARLQELTES